jgi:Family of unknown function (DUF6193)
MLKRLLNFFKSKTLIQKMYPELEKVGGLQNAINIELEKHNSILKVSNDPDLVKIPLTYARIENGQKFSQVYIGAEEKLYLPDFWKEGVCLAHGKTENISELGQVLDYWLYNNTTTKELAEKFSFVTPNEKALAFDENNEIEYTWNSILQDKSREEIHDFVKIAIKDEVLNSLFPFTSLYTLCFSRCTGYPYDTDNLPNVTPKQFENFAPVRNEKSFTQQDENKLETKFVVTKNKNEFLGVGNAEEALRIIKLNLPDDLRPARKGTADN